ncbi:SRPBCC family protein [Mycobacterium hubeiense]|uniref:SRPBCC family protein n=1 Tax=Mycobacterium hubeiense TaxID=1867256 RepID=UPI000C7ED38F|nr:SRPBCC family protein [Mycobacterium sp. QGD 101]
MTGRDGKLTIEGERAVLTFERRLPYPVEKVWSAITDPAHRNQWMGQTTIDPREGGVIEMVPTGPPQPPEQKKMTGRIRVWDPPRVFEHEWSQRVLAGTEPSVVRYELERDGEGTLLRFSHRGLGVSDAQGFLPGTGAFFDRLEAYLADKPMPNWAKRYEEIAGAPPTAWEK